MRRAGSPRFSWSTRPGQGPHRDPRWIRRSVLATDRPSLCRERSLLALRCRYRSAVLHQQCRRDVDFGGLDGSGARHRSHRTLAMPRPAREVRGVAGQQGADARRARRTPRLQALHSSVGAMRAKSRFPAPGCRQLRLWHTALPAPADGPQAAAMPGPAHGRARAICDPHRTVLHRALEPAPTTDRAVSPAVMASLRSPDAWPLPHGHAQRPPNANRRRLPQALGGQAGCSDAQHPHRSRRCVAVRLGARVGGWVLLVAGRHADPPVLAVWERLHWLPVGVPPHTIFWAVLAAIGRDRC
jgi:hypothetical protein